MSVKSHKKWEKLNQERERTESKRLDYLFLLIFFLTSSSSRRCFRMVRVWSGVAIGTLVLVPPSREHLYRSLVCVLTVASQRNSLLYGGALHWHSFFRFFFYFLSQLSQTVVVVVNSLLQVDRGPFPYWLGLLLLLLLSFKVLDSLACVCKSGFHSLSLNFSVFSLPLGARAEEEQYWDQKSIWKIKKTKVFQVFGFRVCLVSSCCCCCWSTTRHDTRVVVWPLSSLEE